MINDIQVMIAGHAGDGVLFTGNVLGKILKRQGWEVATYRDFPSNIRGEATNYTIRASLSKITNRGDAIDVLIAFDCDAILRHLNSIAEHGVILCEGRATESIRLSPKKGRTFHKFPMREMAQKNLGNEIFKNTILLGGLCYILSLDLKIIEEVLTDVFLSKKGTDIVRKNIQAVKLGCDEAEKIVRQEERHKLEERPDSGRLFISGDEAIALGSLAAGCRFFAAYPICPATEIWQWMIKHIHTFNGLVVQTEDEIAAINMALGAAYAGARSMTATSGPGASLMMEAFSLAGMAEIPIVIVHVQRVGPSTGLPTRPEQSDLDQWVFGGHGDFPRIVLSPGTIEECFSFVVDAFKLAEKYQCPVILLTEQNYGQNFYTVEKFDFSRIVIDRGMRLSQEELLKIKDYKRYAFTDSGVSPRAIPSMKNGIHMVEGNEHDEKGYREEEEETRIKMMNKRMKKLKSAVRDVIPPQFWGNPDAEVGIIGFGSTVCPIREAMDQLEHRGVPCKYLQIRTLWPFSAPEVEEFMTSCSEVFVVENNFSGQLHGLIQGQGVECSRVQRINKYSGHTFRPIEITERILEALKR